MNTGMSNFDLSGSSILGLSDGLSDGLSEDDSSSLTEKTPSVDLGEFLVALSPWMAPGDATGGNFESTNHLNDWMGTALGGCGALDGLDVPSLDPILASDPNMYLDFDPTHYGQASEILAGSSFFNVPVTTTPGPASFFDGGSVGVS